MAVAATGVYERLRGLGPFAHLGVSDLLDVAGVGRWIEVEAGQAVVRQGEPAEAFYAIASGRLEVSEDGVVRRELGAGDHFGEIGLIEAGCL